MFVRGKVGPLESGIPRHRVRSLKSSAFVPFSCTCPKYDFNIFSTKNISIYVPSVLVSVSFLLSMRVAALYNVLRLSANINRRAYYTMRDACPASMDEASRRQADARSCASPFPGSVRIANG